MRRVNRYFQLFQIITLSLKGSQQLQRCCCCKVAGDKSMWWNHTAIQDVQVQVQVYISISLLPILIHTYIYINILVGGIMEKGASHLWSLPLFHLGCSHIHVNRYCSFRYLCPWCDCVITAFDLRSGRSSFTDNLQHLNIIFLGIFF